MGIFKILRFLIVNNNQQLQKMFFSRFSAFFIICFNCLSAFSETKDVLIKYESEISSESTRSKALS
jgi:hypothetical protein